ncbi:PAS domain S-box protein [Fulvivirga sedimenti]|uniref:PAS domain S-box protein n=1 Tax=Fulvivirga sedimenti TaxID=2879465 RepID=A0A9X1KYC3_9BACT|nr:PAS domain S-box protein [Fulvivirga sedimenti]MCA6074682.1 PAS domain S-box protein [Fulvivirga sedimenti]MCA6075859.1 PAS domain S-box protein [Fulvivirga sedimenti]MCA6076987.1 PAS domain S-box protein [Fulvivirga sedimenti]
MATKKEIRQFFNEVHGKSNRIIEKVLFGYFAFGILLSFFYDTWIVGIGVGSLCLILYFGTKAIFKENYILQYVGSLVFGIFMAQFIYQMHGLFEMHFTAFIAIIAMITYQNKWAFLPQLLFVVVHHSAFAYIQYLGVVNENIAYQQIYFTQLEFMDFQTFLFHAGLYAFGVILAAIYAHNLAQHTISNAENILKLRASDAITSKNIEIANEIANGNLETEIELREGDLLGAALMEMRNSLKESSEREKEERFINLGIAELSEIIRAHDNDLDELSYQVISYLVKYLKANQGAIFIHTENEDGEYLELKGCYAYNRKKFLNKKIEIGEGLVGQCFLEREPTLLKEIPEGYLNITSGLGEASPRFLAVLPIKTDQIIEGVIEIATFKDFEQFQIDFLIKVCESIASVIASAKVNSKTKMLFEKSQEQTEMLRSQDEEMRQNMEELSATQEEMQRKSKEFESRFQALNESNLGFVEFDMSGKIINTNTAFARMLSFAPDDLLGQKYSSLISTSEKDLDTFQALIRNVRPGEPLHGRFEKIASTGKIIAFQGSYSMITDVNGEPSGILHVGIPLSTTVEKSAELVAE